MKMKRLFAYMAFAYAATQVVAATSYREVSVAGFIPFEGSGREVISFNPGWRFLKGDDTAASGRYFDDSNWEVVSVPHSVELLPAEGSGCRNYQGPAWYRKKFVIPAHLKGKEVSLHFEAAMGKKDIYVNGKEYGQHYGGYLPFNVHLSQLNIQPGDTCQLAIRIDNSNDKSYPPGKPQYTLDFAYHGGVYRDVWMIGRSPVAITDAVEANRVATGGVFVHTDEISSKSARVTVDTEIANHTDRDQDVVVENTLLDAQGKKILSKRTPLKLRRGAFQKTTQALLVRTPRLWSPQSPYLYRVQTCILQGRDVVDGGITRVGIRKAEFRGKDGFWLNDQPFGQLIGANRHQDFAYVGNAMPNSQQYRDVLKLKEAGCNIIRSAHYPQDPAFMDACDELGIFVIVATPGWQYWNKAPEFRHLVHQNTREMIRRDRNHASVLMWEPILNETRFPLDFSLEALQITHDEYPYPGRPVAAADLHSAGVAEHYDVVYGWPADEGKTRQCIFTREFGENVDDWYAHNNNNRASRSWGERPMNVQAHSLAVSYDEMYHTSGQFIGGAQWHPFDHQRGYHPDPYWGGQFDCFRQPKYAYNMFRSQTSPLVRDSLFESGPMTFIMHEISPFSEKDVTVFSNCDSVRLIVYGKDTLVKAVEHPQKGMPNKPVVFKDVYDFWQMREYTYVQKNWQQVSFRADGIVAGKVVCSSLRMPSRRSTRLSLRTDHPGSLIADGSDFLVVIAEVTDDSGNVRRLAKENISFTVEGEAEIIGDERIGANPRAVEFGSAPVLIRSSLNPGKIRIRATVQFEGTHAPQSAELEIESVAPVLSTCYLAGESQDGRPAVMQMMERVQQLSPEEAKQLLKEVEQQQTDFGETHKKK